MPIIPTEADLDASVEMLAFMWVSIGGDPASVTTLTLVRTLLAQNFAQLPPELQTLFADGRAK